jgi:lipopolysaccharide exporter
MTGAVTGLTVSVVLALALRNAWALAIGQLTIAVMTNVLSYVYFPERPRFVLDRAAVGKLFGFGKWVVLTSLVSYVAMEGDRYVAGGRFGVAALGLYTFMSMLVKTIVLDIGKSVTNVFYPAYVLLRHDHRRLSDAFLRSYETLACVLAPSCLLLALVAGDFVTVVLDAKWAPGIGLLKILGIGGVAYALIASGSGLINGVGKPRFNTLGEFVRMLVLFAGLAWFPPRFGVAGVAIAMVGTNVLGAALYLMMWSRVLRMPLRRFARPLATVGATLAAVWGGVALVRPLAEPGGLRLVLTLGAAGLAYLAVLAAAAHWFRAGPLQHVFGGVAPGWQFAVGLPERLKMRNKPRTKPGDGRPGTDITPNS